MSFMKTLARVAIGVAIAKGVGAMVQGAQTRGSAGGAGGGGSFGGPASPGRSGGTATGAAPGGLEDLMGSVLGGAAKRPTAKTAPQGGHAAPDPAGGLGGLLEQLAGGKAGKAGAPRQAQTSGGLDDLLGQLGAGGALGGLLGSLAGAAGAAPGRAEAPAPGKAQPGFGELLNQSLQNYGEPDVPPAPAQEAAAALMLKAMIQAAKADGKVDEDERRKLIDSLGDATKEELDFVKAELAAPVSIERLAAEVPKGLEQQVYAMSVMAITLDERVEAQYLHELAQGLGLSPQQVNAIHAEVGAVALYA
jgi:uncharacterized membrane protein YebE (DUF533 family)